MKRLLLAAILVLAAAYPAAAGATVRVKSTTDTVDAGLVADVLMPMWNATYPSDPMTYSAVGTGKALDDAKAGLADVVVTHAKSLEKQFVADGYSLEPYGRAIFYSDYVVVGPNSDPANVTTLAPHDAALAFEVIGKRGKNNSDVTFVSRGENSGTNVEEQNIWNLTSDADIPLQTAHNAGSATDRKTPVGTGGPPSFPAWYKESNKGQLASLQDASVCNTATYTQGNCYTILDRGTFNRAVNNGTVTNMKIVSQINDGSARGGKDLLINPFSVYIVKSTSVSPPSDEAEGAKFADFLVSPAFQAAVDTYPSVSDPAFHADAYPAVTLTSALPASVVQGSIVALNVHLANRQPGTPAVNGMPVQLQQSTDGGATYSNVGLPANTDASGNVAFNPTVAQNTSYRVSLGTFQATDWNAFSPNTQPLGAVAATQAPPPTPIGNGGQNNNNNNNQTATPHRAPRVTGVLLKSKSVTFRVNGPGVVKIGVNKITRKRVRRNGRLRTVTVTRRVRTFTRTIRKAGKVTLRWNKALGGGTFRVVVTTRAPRT